MTRRDKMFPGLGSARRWRAPLDGSSNGPRSEDRTVLCFSITGCIARDAKVFGGPPKTARQRRALPK